MHEEDTPALAMVTFAMLQEFFVKIEAMGLMTDEQIIGVCSRAASGLVADAKAAPQDELLQQAAAMGDFCAKAIRAKLGPRPAGLPQ